MPPLAIMGGIAAATSLGGALFGAHAAGKAADTQSQAAMYAADQQKAAADQALGFQKQQYQTGQNEMAPWLSSGTGALANLSNLLGLPVFGNATLPGAGAAPRGGPRMGGPVSTPGMAAPGGMNIAGSYRGGGGGSLMSDRFHSPLMGGPASGLRSGGTVTLNPDGSRFNGATNPNPGAGGLQTHQVPMQSLINPALGAKGSLLTPFQAPTDVTMQNDPGYKFRLQEGQNAIERSAAARGGVLTGGTEKALQDYTQGQASNEYQNVYNRAHDTYQTNYLNKLNPLMAMAGLGQQTGGQLLSAGNNSANNISDILMSLGNSQAQGINNAGAARGSGYLNSAGAWGGAMNGIGNSLQQMMLMRQLFPGGSGGGGYPDFTGGGGGNYNPVTGGY